MPLHRATAAALLLGAALALTGCEQVAIIKSAPVVVSFDQKYGNNALAASDANALETALRQRGQLWNLRFDLLPAAAGNIETNNEQAVVAARGRTTSLGVTIAAAAQSTITGFSARGPEGEQAYLQQILQIIANAGYTGITSARVDVWFNGSHHAVLTWTSRTGFVYKVLDGKP
jgi:hypothetical protein